MKVIVVNESKKHIASKDLQRLIAAICDFFLTRRVRNRIKLKQKKELSVVFLTSVQMKKINRGFRGKNKATDILSFTSEDPQSLGELLLCVPVLQRQARDQKHSLRSEIAYMLAHGVLHLLEYDHEISVKEEKLMFKLQDRCFESLKISQAAVLRP